MEAEDVKPPLTRSLAEQLLGFLDHLRNSGFDVGIRQYIMAQDALVALAAGGLLPCHPERLRNWLAPIVCGSPKEQDAFYNEFAVWLDQHPDLRAVLADEKVSASQPEQVDEDGRPRARRRTRTILASVLITAACVLAIYIARVRSFPVELPPLPNTVTGTVFAGSGIEVSSVAGASISSQEDTTVADDNGHFSITFHAEAKQAELVISHSDYEPVSLSVNPADSAPLIVELKRASQRELTQATLEIELSSEDEARFGKVIERINQLANDPAFREQPGGWKLFYLRYYRYIRSSLAGAPLLFVGIWWLTRIYHRRLMLKKHASEIEPQLDRLAIKGTSEKLFSGELFRHTVQKFRLHGEVVSNQLDPTSTIEVTVKHGGWFKPVYGMRNVLPEYLVLIDRASFNDQRARLVDAMLDRLIDGGVFVQRYYFDGDPRSCRKREPKSPGLSLPDLAAKHPEHRLMVFGEGASFLDPLTLRPQLYLELFSFWKDKAFFTSQSPAHWGYSESVLAASDFLVLPATESGLAAFVETIHTGLVNRVNGGSVARQFPEMLRDSYARWLIRDDPGKRVKDRLCAQLRHYLGDDGYYWLSACAIYPSLQWDITLFLGYNLTGAGGRLLDEQRLLSIVRLPWFRYANMPDWLRLRLVSEMSSTRERAARGALEHMLLSALDHPAEGAQLEIARETDWPLARRRQKKLEQFLRALPDDSPLREHVFLSFMSAHRLSSTAVRLPETVRRFLFKDGIRILGPRPAAAAALAGVVALAGWVAMTRLKPALSAASLIPFLTYVSDAQEKTELAIGNPFARSDKSLSEYSDLLIRQNVASLGSLIQHYLPNFSALQPDTLLEDNLASFQLRSDLYKEWLKETLTDAARIDEASFRFYATRLSESSDWKAKPLYLTPPPPQSALNRDSLIADTQPPPDIRPGARTTPASATPGKKRPPRRISPGSGVVAGGGVSSERPVGVGRGKGCPGSNKRLQLDFVDVYGDRLNEPVDISLNHLSHSITLSRVDTSKSFRIADLCSGIYHIQVSPKSYLPVSRFLRAGEDQIVDAKVTLPIDPRKVIGVDFPDYRSLPAEFQAVLGDSNGIEAFEGKQGPALYSALDPLRKACLLNIATKSSVTLLNNGRSVFSYFKTLIRLRQDKLFAVVSEDLAYTAKSSAASGLLSPVSDALHLPPAGYTSVGSFKTSELYGNLQVTLFTVPIFTTGRSGKEYIAEIDIDDNNGIVRAFQATTADRITSGSHPYVIHEILVSYQKIDPGYRLNTISSPNVNTTQK